MLTSNLGYPRIGENREWKKALESFWANDTTEEQLLATMKELRLNHLRVQQEQEVDLIPVGDFTLYDHVLDMAVMFGIIPKRFLQQGDTPTLSTYFAMARGSKNAQACEMTKWYNTNYHYIVPELHDAAPRLTKNAPLEAYLEAKNELGIDGKPVILGPYSFVKLAKGYEEDKLQETIQSLLPLYIQVIQELVDAGARSIQVDEPSLVTSISAREMALVTRIYEQINEAIADAPLFLQTYFDAVTFYEEVVSLPVKGIGLDFVHGGAKNLEALRTFGFPEDKVLAAGIIDGRNIWISNLRERHELVHQLEQHVAKDRLVLQPSCSLLHVPVTTKREEKLDPTLLGVLAFANEKLTELHTLKQLAAGNEAEVKEALEANDDALAALEKSGWRSGAATSHNLENKKRPQSFNERRPVQEEKWQLPLLPTTTIGSFPQTKDVRRTRSLWRKGELSTVEYERTMKSYIEKWINIQEELGLDVLVHGEFERNDMVEFFGEKLDGFAFTANGWVQSYGSRCVKPPIIYGNVSFTEPMTVAETVYAQSLTDKPVKGMLTGPVTILNWSFVRDDLPLTVIAHQIAEALTHEVTALEEAGIEMIQIDEPAIREGLPLKAEDQQEYLDWAVSAFRASCAHVKATTQIHTHMCYSEFHEMIEAIDDLDADVISIETSRSHGEMISAFEKTTYEKGIGLGVYDIHSPRVPSEEEMLNVIRRALTVLPASLFWVNPDCGLKTRAEKETVAALKNMVAAARAAREELKTKA
ncbi:5-methyltetrahydropteroyltriglutamate--homocysteine S-methyltransferase [Halalkalibacterium halodurans]|uniref:5-methyltetrahydropteroyltriglutamate--homocysteine methyltransferase n=1 Tax=Halalkalibacterium halodurans TaxID=86665 RepID=A0A0M0KEY1_ALKHA|nr:5-methyltetrahydropteroyltriglutamate--homocysteine S-methyltransferase [Halalkalibacterium halodurans]MDY7220939.1 5-methyltetrahydropteroyltriglutamate--homocysteine S-methyltransferase [Halalkalibacterium halodurans]MDY7240178.1 5-methyltetrahydropteroyltriglutamate--homocysteine S-methyltransferase [Halalkalibacterium halodurans]TES51789.1 5-methyltetrahydropteroyltriglutamate--homocysteine S-methyltransferase [Halalkalibacterium halodurans]TPE69755.1 5-methyltetrahydropteroyltriglutamat